MPAADTADQTIAFLLPRGALEELPRHVVGAARALPVNGRTLVIPHDRPPRRDFQAELEVVVGPPRDGGTFGRVALHSVATTELSSRAFLSWVRTSPVALEPALDPDPWDGDNPLARALGELPARLAAGGLAGFWQAAVELGLAREADVSPAERERWAKVASRELAVTARPVVVTVAAPTDWRWRFWPPSFW